MISKIRGKVVEERDSLVVIDLNGISYDVFLPGAVKEAIRQEINNNQEVELVTYHYLQMTQSTGIPILIGFKNQIEKEFFEKFISVSGVGPKAACKALSEPFSLIAGAIDSGDEGFLKKLPGIGGQRARQIVAKLQGKVGKFGLIQDGTCESKDEQENIKDEALSVLLQLQYKQVEANNMIDKALKRNPDIKTCEELLNEVYKGRTS